MDKNISFSYTLEKYNKKYSKHRHRLLKYSKKDVEDFDKQYGHYTYNGKTHSLEYKDYLLRNRKWTLIGDTYYEIPTFKTYFLAWWILLPAAGHIAFASVTTAAVASAVVFPTLAATGVFNKGGATPEPGPQPEPIKWYEDQEYLDSLDSDDVGTLKDVVVNGVTHKVRLIGVDCDELADGSGKAHSTWEFANLISDSNGYSLAYQWNDSNSDKPNNDYSNSTLRYALTGEGWDGGASEGEKRTTILAAQKGENNWSATYKNQTILSMLPSNLRDKLKTVKIQYKYKPSGSYYFSTAKLNDKLFVLSVKELGYTSYSDNPSIGEAYPYYKYHTSFIDEIRIKKQVKNEVLTNTSTIAIDPDQQYQNVVTNYAGYNGALDDSNGSNYFLRCQSTSNVDTFYCTNLGNDEGIGSCCACALPIAPAFCL